MKATADFLKRFNAINVWKKHDQRAPHKPLLILYALGRWQQGLTEVTFREAEPVLTGLLQRFGPPRRSDHPEEPFWRLQRDGVWQVETPGRLAMKASGKIPTLPSLRSLQVRACFTPDVQAGFRSDPSLVSTIAVSILAEHFPESYHEDLLDAVGLSLQPVGIGLQSVASVKKRDPHFRNRVLTAYEYRCAVCGFDVRLGKMPIALEAAHIRWHQADGPDTEDNGLALCVLHHKTFDHGAFTVKDAIILVSDQAHGTAGFQECLMAFHEKSLRHPQRPKWRPEPKHVEWHGREVFKGSARHRE